MIEREPYDFLGEGPVAFFDEGWEECGDLMTRAYDKDLAFGSINRMVTAARRALDGVPSEAVRPILRLGDAMIQAAAEAGVINDTDGSPVTWNKGAALQLSHLTAMPLVIGPLSASAIWLQDEEMGFAAFEVTPTRFCAAYVLRATFSALDFGYVDGLDDLPICYLMQASAVYGYLSVLQRDLGDSVRQIVVQDEKAERARSMATHRWNKDPQREMWRIVFEEWIAWRDNRAALPKPSDFRRSMQLRFPDLVDGTLKNKMSMWEREHRGESKTP